MLSTLLNIDRKGDVFLQDNSIVQLPKLWEVYKHKNMGSNMVRYVVWMYDNKSVYRQHPLDKRKEKVIYAIWKDKPNKYINHKLVQEASLEYQDMQYDPDIESYQISIEQAHKVNEAFRNMKVTSENIEDVNKIQIDIAKAAKSRQELLQIIKKNKESDKQVFGKGNMQDMRLSMMEQKLKDEEG